MHYVIIGNGITGITAARTIRKNSDHDITVISGETDHFFSRTALMYIYMGHMRYKDTKPYEDWFWQKNKIALKRAWVEQIDSDNKSLRLSDDSTITYDKLLIASGSVPNKYGWPGQDLDGVQGLYSYQDLEMLEKNTANGIERAVIVGGGLIGIELAEMLHSRHYSVTLLVRESKYWNNVLPDQESDMISRHFMEHGFDLRLGSELKEILDDGQGKVRGVITASGEEIPCQLVGLTAGVSPNIGWLAGSGIATQRGILVDHHQRTNVEDIYAAGDCAQFHQALPDRRPVEQVWYTGKIQGENAAMNILGRQQAYAPGYWFNSAKFLDIEYQTYGMVMPQLREGEQDFYWEDKGGKKCIHLVYRASDRLFIGINTFGIRMRHTVFNKWLKDRQTVDHVLQYIAAAAFDPEFFTNFQPDFLEAWNNAHPSYAVKPAKKKNLLQLIFNN
jgi:NAD(P)H-nitrite reductase large subunit